MLDGQFPHCFCKCRNLVLILCEWKCLGISLVVQQLRLRASNARSNAGEEGWIHGGELRSHMPRGVAKKKKSV